MTPIHCADACCSDPGKGIEGTVDGYLEELQTSHHKLSKTKVAGLAGKRLAMSGSYFGAQAVSEVRIVWDPKTRRLYSVLAMTAGKKLPPSARAFLDSFAIVTPD